MTEKAGAKLPDAVLTAFLLLPGFITIRVSEYYSTTDKLSEVETVASALAFTVVTFVCSLLLWHSGERMRKRPRSEIGVVVQRPLFLALIVAVSIGFGFMWACVDSHDWAYKVSPTRRVSRQPIWQWLFDTNAARAEARFVKVTLKDGTVYFGPPARYSRSEEEKTLYLEPAAKIDGPGDEKAKDGPDAGRPRGPVLTQTRPCSLVTGGVFVRKEVLDIVEFYPVTRAEKTAKDYCELLVEKTGGVKKAGVVDSSRNKK